MITDEVIPMIFRNLDEIRYRLLRVLTLFIVLFGVFIVFSIKKITFLGYSFYFLYPDVYHNIGAELLSVIEKLVLAPGTQLLIVRPADGLTADAYTCMFLALVFSMPYIIYHISMFLGPALKRNERVLLKTILVPASLLFVAGAMMGLFWVAPAMFAIFNRFDLGLGAQTTMSLMNFVSFLLLYLLAFGVSFEVPVFMYGLTRAGMVQANFWSKNWRYAIVGSLLFGYLVSPGVTGFTEVLMALPMIGLYFGGVFFSRRYEKKMMQQESNTISEPF